MSLDVRYFCSKLPRTANRFPCVPLLSILEHFSVNERMESHTRVTSEWEELFSLSRISAHVISEELGQILMQYDLSAHTKMFDEVEVFGATVGKRHRHAFCNSIDAKLR